MSSGPDRLRSVIHISAPGVDRELQCFTCAHCGRVGIVNARYDPDTFEVTSLDPEHADNGGYCYRCDAYLCRSEWCYDQRDRLGNPIHLPYIKVIDESAKDRPGMDISAMMSTLNGGM